MLNFISFVILYFRKLPLSYKSLVNLRITNMLMPVLFVYWVTEKKGTFLAQMEGKYCWTVFFLFLITAIVRIWSGSQKFSLYRHAGEVRITVKVNM